MVSTMPFFHPELLNQAGYVLALVTVYGFAAVFALGAYFFPSIIGWLQKKRNLTAIFMLNFFLGWTVIGWIVALVWAFINDSPTPARQNS